MKHRPWFSLAVARALTMFVGIQFCAASDQVPLNSDQLVGTWLISRTPLPYAKAGVVAIYPDSKVVLKNALPYLHANGKITAVQRGDAVEVTLSISTTIGKIPRVQTSEHIGLAKQLHQGIVFLTADLAVRGIPAVASENNTVVLCRLSSVPFPSDLEYVDIMGQLCAPSSSGGDFSSPFRVMPNNDGELTRQLAERLLNLALPPADTLTFWPEGFQKALDDGIILSSGTMAWELSKIGSIASGGLLKEGAPAGFGMKREVKLPQSLPNRIKEITGIRHLIGNSFSVEYVSETVLPVELAGLSRYFYTTAKGEKSFSKYDDGWRVVNK